MPSLRTSEGKDFLQSKRQRPHEEDIWQKILFVKMSDDAYRIVRSTTEQTFNLLVVKRISHPRGNVKTGQIEYRVIYEYEI